MICRDEANKYKLRLNQLYKEIDSYKASLHSAEKQLDKLKHLNSELNRSLGEERSINMQARNRVHEQVIQMSHKVEELESASIENTNREHYQKPEYSSRVNKTPGTVRSNASGMYSSHSKSDLVNHTPKHRIDSINDELRFENEQLKQQLKNYQNAVNKLQGEKQQMYQSLNQFKLGKLGESSESQNMKSGFATPVTKAPSTSIKKNHTFGSTSEKDKSEAIIEYLRAEIVHLRDKYKKIDIDFANFKTKLKSQKDTTISLAEFMSELLRPAKDLIYQLCSDPHLSESYFYKEDDRFHSIDGKYCLDVIKIFNVSVERIVELRSQVAQKDDTIKELNREKFIYEQQKQYMQQQNLSNNQEIENNFMALDQK